MIEFITPKNIDNKFELMEFVYNNTDSFIMNTFGYVWESRNWWDKFPIQVYRVGNVIAGLHAYTINTKAPSVLKTYYIVTGKAFRGQGIAKKLTLNSIIKHRYECNTYYVNSEEKSGGVEFYTKYFGNRFKMEKNQFGTFDYIFEVPFTYFKDEI